VVEEEGMLRSAVRCWMVAVALAAPLVVAATSCYDPAGDCNDTLTCTPPDAGDAGEEDGGGP
jgi:hypothetical protein